MFLQAFFTASLFDNYYEKFQQEFFISFENAQLYYEIHN